MDGWGRVDMAFHHGSPRPISSSSSESRPLSCMESEALFRMLVHELLRMPLPGGRVPVVVDERPLVNTARRLSSSEICSCELGTR
jgi:hypothetical protein